MFSISQVLQNSKDSANMGVFISLRKFVILFQNVDYFKNKQNLHYFYIIICINYIKCNIYFLPTLKKKNVLV